MPRKALIPDPFHAIAAPRRRQLVELLARGGARARAVGEMVEILGLPQSAVSKNLGVLLKVGLVSVTRQGQHRLYELNAKELKPVYEWAKHFERFWGHQADRIKARAERVARERAAVPMSPPPSQEKPYHKEH